VKFFQPSLQKKLASKRMVLFDVYPFHISHSFRSLVVHYSGYPKCYIYFAIPVQCGREPWTPYRLKN